MLLRFSETSPALKFEMETRTLAMYAGLVDSIFSIRPFDGDRNRASDEFRVGVPHLMSEASEIDGKGLDGMPFRHTIIKGEV